MAAVDVSTVFKVFAINECFGNKDALREINKLLQTGRSDLGIEVGYFGQHEDELMVKVSKDIGSLNSSTHTYKIWQSPAARIWFMPNADANPSPGVFEIQEAKDENFSCEFANALLMNNIYKPKVTLTCYMQNKRCCIMYRVEWTSTAPRLFEDFKITKALPVERRPAEHSVVFGLEISKKP